MPESTRARADGGEAFTALFSQPARLGGPLFRQRRADAYARHSPSVEFGDFEAATIDLDNLTERRQVAELRHQEARDRLIRAFGQGDGGLLGEVVGVQQA